MHTHSMRRFLCVLGVCLLLTTGATPIHAADPDPAPAAPTPIMAFDEVKVGMKGYGKTVFHGSEVEPFGFEVVSVISDSSAQRGTVWVICSDERMMRSGPVQGMSGSPMYVWEEGEEGTIGEGGRLIGAFAFGYSDVNVCLVGVQPIEYMREVGDRALEEDLDEAQVSQVPPGTMQRSIVALETAAERVGASEQARSGLLRMQELMSHSPQLKPTQTQAEALASVQVPAGLATGGDVVPMHLPMSVGNAQTAEFFAPLLAPAGIAARSSPITSVAGKPPSNVDPAKVKLEPGSVLSIPLAYGDMDVNAAGTVTDVLPDGTVLGFGHAMNSVGSSRLPMASGYTHFVVSRDSISFKLASSLDIVGSIVRDEASAVAGVGDIAFISAPVNIQVDLPAQPTRNYSYHAVDHFLLTPNIVALLASSSLNAVQGTPILHTMHATGTMTFTGGRTFELDSLIPGQGMNGLMFDMLPPMIALMQNPFEPLKLESADLTIKVEEGIHMASMVSASLDQRVAKPGDTVQVTLTLQPFDGPAFTRTLPFTLPTDLTEGEYQLLISDADSYSYRMIASRPDLANIDDADQLLRALQTIADVDPRGIYVGLPLQRQGIAVGGQAMNDLPSSRAMVLASTASSTTMPFPRFVESAYPADQVISGELFLPLRVVPDQP
ncbi:hypothetical protein [Algisphaera agarilytica]|uniref:Peptidase S55 domain-containing protein n=1 Tax=Algisphaera agarilytica TaxID=1385975 RepID=A0A7X0H9L9_9BACT|nr:hypothetical protein [Algisphaera agarilytica]MBB6431623.1 hypothetical protein [Algisphaera agarilytica]